MTYVMTTHGSQAEPETYRKIVEQVGEHADGLIARYAGMSDSGLAITTVWETKAHSDRFAAEHLLPAIREITGGMPRNPATIDFEAFDVELRTTS